MRLRFEFVIHSRPNYKFTRVRFVHLGVSSSIGAILKSKFDPLVRIVPKFVWVAVAHVLIMPRIKDIVKRFLVQA